MSGETKTYGPEELAAMTPAEFNEALLKAIKIEGKVLVRDQYGNPKYDDPSLAGTYGEELVTT